MNLDSDVIIADIIETSSKHLHICQKEMIYIQYMFWDTKWMKRNLIFWPWFSFKLKSTHLHLPNDIIFLSILHLGTWIHTERRDDTKFNPWSWWWAWSVVPWWLQSGGEQRLSERSQRQRSCEHCWSKSFYGVWEKVWSKLFVHYVSLLNALNTTGHVSTTWGRVELETEVFLSVKWLVVLH